MLNYVWAGLIILSLVFGIAYDVRDLSNDTYKNGGDFEITISSETPLDSEVRRQDVTILIDPLYYTTFYGVEDQPETSYAGVLINNQEGSQIRFAKDAALPEPWETIRSQVSARDNDMRGTLTLTRGVAELATGADNPVTGASGPSTAAEIGATVRFKDVRFVKMNAISAAAFSMAETAVQLALSLIGILALWMGLLKIAEKAGLIQTLVKYTQPVLRPLFPEIPKDHPALGMIVLNLTANMLGLGNAATPLGIKAMEELQRLNSDKETATDSMVMLLAMNTASVQLVPPVLLVALMGLQINQLIFAIIIVTTISLVVAIVSARLLSKMKRYRATAPAPLVEG